MNRLLAVSGGIILLVTAGAWATSSGSPLFRQAPRERTVTAVQIPQPAASKDRTLLSPEQLRQAIATGTLDRPVKSLLTVKAPMQFGDFAWNETGVPQGPTWIRVDLQSQILSVFRAGHEIGATVIVYGGDDKQTPTGKLHILGKAKDHRSSLYDAPMPYTLRLTDDGVSIHGSSVRWGAATHGCIGVPLDFARRLFAAAKPGDEVLVVGAGRASKTS